jgi:hypothetical protein
MPRANNEIEKLRKNTTAELQTLKAELRKSEIKISSLDLNVQQKVMFIDNFCLKGFLDLFCGFALFSGTRERSVD